jgi:ligand-binding sensor domain-containing protein
MMDVTSLRWVCLCAVLLWGGAATSQTNGRDRGIGQFYHARWTIKDGAPGQISAIAQTRDGFLWIAAAAALYSFDGVRFERFEPPSGDPITTIQALAA